MALSDAVPAPRPQAGRTRRADARRATSRRSNSLLLALVLLAAGTAMLVLQEPLARVEAHLTAAALQLFTIGRTSAAGPIMFIGIGSGEVHGLMITPMCSTVLLVAPMLLLAGALELFPRYRVLFVLKGLAMALPIAIAANLARYALIAFALQVWGRTGFDIMHHWVGSLLVILVTAGAVVLLLVVATRGRVRIRPGGGRHGR